MSTGRHADVTVIGAGIVGLATARSLMLQRPDLRIIVVEKEGSIAGHQTGRNSGVLHAGVYYAPGSDKARFCADGRRRMVEFCREHDIAHEVCGKLVVATTTDEVPRLDELQRRCELNGVSVERVEPERMREIEPHVTGLAALHVKETGIVDFPGVCRAIADELATAGVELRLGTRVIGCDTTGASSAGDLVLHTDRGDITTGRVVNCAGLHADRIARLIGGEAASRGLMIVPFRGEYFELAPSRSHLVKGLIYPVPDPQFPFLGVHLTRSVHGGIHAGPNAVLALAREGYSWRAIDLHDLAETLQFTGFRVLAKQHWRYGLQEMGRSLNRATFARALARLVPEVSVDDLEPAPAGVRAQALHPDGRLADDFEFGESHDGRAVHVLNAPSPAATASLAIGDEIAARLLRTLA